MNQKENTVVSNLQELEVANSLTETETELKPHNVLVIESDKVLKEETISLDPPPYEDTAPNIPPRRNRKNLTLPGEQDDSQSENVESLQEDDEEEQEEPSRPQIPMEVYATIVAAFSFLCIGLQRAYTSPALDKMKEDHEFFSGDKRLTSTVISWFAASPPLASFFGTILSGLTLQYLGRQKTLVFLSLPFIAGWVTIAFSNNIPMLMCGRALTGLATGFSTAAAPMYVSECVRKNIRGFLGMIGPMMLSLGILLGFVLSTINVGWQTLAFIMTIFPILLLVCALTLPESPIYLLQHGREKEAVESLKKLRDLSVEASLPPPPSSIKSMHETRVRINPQLELDQKRLNGEIEHELEEMKRVLKKRHSLPNTVALHHTPEKRHSHDSIDSQIDEEEPETFMQFVFTELLSKREIRYPAFITASLMIFQQFTGANAIIYYLSVILNEADPHLQNTTFFNSFHSREENHAMAPREGLDLNVASVVFGLVQFFSFFFSLVLVDRIGRRILLMVSAFLMIFPHLLLGLYFWVKLHPTSTIHVYKYSSIIGLTSGWLPLTCLCFFIFAYSLGFSSIPFLIMSEVFPSSSRSYMVALASLVNHLTLFFIIRVFPTFLDLLGAHIVFWFFAVCCFLALIHVFIWIPETKQLTLMEIELKFRKGDKNLKVEKEERRERNHEKCKCKK